MSIKNRKLQVFVSSTFTDLRDERQAAVEAILSTGNIPAGMELFAACDQSQMEVIKEWIQESDVYLLILGGRYGSIESLSDKSYTQLEYEYALEIGKPHFAVVVSEKGLALKVANQGKKEVVEIDCPEKHEEFKKFVTRSKMVRFWDDLKDIKLSIHETLSNFSKREELIGWVRGDQAVDSGVLAEEMARLNKENRELKMKISENGRLKNGLDFEAVYQNLNKSEIEIIFLKGPFGAIYDRIEVPSINANVTLVLIQDYLTGLIGFSKEDIETIFSPFIKFNLINIETREDQWNIDSNHFPRFSSEGASYLLYLERQYPEIASEYLI